MDAYWLEIVLAYGRECQIPIGKDRYLGSVGGMDRIACGPVDDDPFDIGEVLHPEQRQLVRRHQPDPFYPVHLSTFKLALP